MADPNDSFLLREYAERQSESAFTELVRRHVNFVYSVAMRYTGNPPDAQDVAQAVFVILARKSASLCGRNTLTGWLYETTRLTAGQLLRTRARSVAREQEAYMQSTLDRTGDDQLWHQLAPHLEEAMARLGADDRELLALRFYESKTGEEAAVLLGIGAAAAHKRTNRALEKLQKFFAVRGVTSTANAIAGSLSANSVQAAPAGLATAISAAVMAKGAAASTSTLTLVKGALKIMAWTKTKTAVVAGIAILLTGGAGMVIVSAKAELEYQRNPVAYEIAHEPPITNDDDLRDQLVGTWQLFAAKDWGDTNFTYFPPNTRHFKIFTLTNSTTVAYDADSNIVFQINGPYQLHGNVYVESIETATGLMSRFRGHRNSFKIRVDGDRYYQMGYGKRPNIEEVWQRVSQ